MQNTTKTTKKALIPTKNDQNCTNATFSFMPDQRHLPVFSGIEFNPQQFGNGCKGTAMDGADAVAIKPLEVFRGRIALVLGEAIIWIKPVVLDDFLTP